MRYQSPSIMSKSIDLPAFTQASGVVITGIDPGGDPNTCLEVTASNLPEGNHTFELAGHWFIDDCDPIKQQFDTCSGSLSFSGVVFIDGKGNGKIACEDLTGCNDCGREHWGDSNIDGEFCLDVAEIDGDPVFVDAGGNPIPLPLCKTDDASVNAFVGAIDLSNKIDQEDCPNNPTCSGPPKDGMQSGGN